MPNTLRIKRRLAGGSAGAPSSLKTAELAFNEQDLTLYYGFGNDGSANATSIIVIGGKGAFMDLTTNQTIAGTKTFSSTIAGSINGNAGTATALQTGRTISITGDISYTSPSFDGTGNVTAAATLATVNSNVGTFTKLTVNGKGLVMAAAQASLSDLAAATADFAVGGFKLTGVADPVNAQDAATKNYVDNAIAGLDAKASVICATTANITLSGTQTIDGVAVVEGNRVLVKNQSTASQNGIYVVAAGAWSRATDMDAWAEVPNAYVWVEQGTSQSDSGWVCTSNAGGTIGSTAIDWVQFNGGSAYTAGNGLQLSGNTFSVLANGTSLDVSASGVRINPTWEGQAAITTVGTLTSGALGTGFTTIGVAQGGTGVATITGLVKGNGTSAFSEAVVDTDYLSPNSIIDGGMF